MSLSELNIDVAIEQLLATAKPDYPEDHKAAMRVPSGGSSCSSCKYLADNKTDCKNEYFQKWHGSAVIPAPIDEFCSDWWEPNEDIEAYGTSEGVKKEWETRIRNAHGIDVDIFNRYARTNPNAISVRSFLDHDPPPEAERVELAKKFLGAEKVGQEDVDIDKLTPLQNTVFKDKVEGIRTVGMHRNPIDVFRYKGKTYVIDGHHRLAVWALDQHDTIPANIYEPKKEKDLDAGEMKAEALFRGIPIEGFTGPGEEAIRAAMSRVPPELLTNVKLVKAAPELQPKHGRYDPDTKTVNINPLIFNLRQRFGKGQGWIYHTELCMCHEIGHSIYYFLPEKMKDQWREISGWMIGTQEGQAPPYEETRPGWPPTTSKWTHREGAKFTRKYAKKNDDEDFADSFAFCILGKPHQMAPAKREFIDNILKARVKKYPTSGVQGPDKPYGERDLNAGGPGSGCNPEVADPRCGRPSLGEKRTLKRSFRMGTNPRQLMRILKDGKSHSIDDLRRSGITTPRLDALLWSMRRTTRPLGFDIKVRNGTVKLVRTNPTANINNLQQTINRSAEKIRRDADNAPEGISQVLPLNQSPRNEPTPARTPSTTDRLYTDLTGRQPPQVQPNPNPDRKPKGFLAKDDKPSLADLTKDNINVMSQDTLDSFEKKFQMSPKDYKAEILQGVPKDIADAETMKVTRESGEDGWSVKFAGAFEMTRSFDLSSGSVDHSYWNMRSSQGKDYGKQIFKNSLDIYDHLGVNTISLHANLNIGGYAWARYGFVPSQESWNSLRGAVRSRMASRAWGDFTEDTKAQIRLISNITDPRAIWLLASLKDSKGEPAGKKLLLGTDWYGKINLNDKEQYAVLKAYLGSKKKKDVGASAELQAEPIPDKPFHNDMLSSEKGAQASDVLASMFAVKHGWSVKDALKWFMAKSIK